MDRDIKFLPICSLCGEKLEIETNSTKRESGAKYDSCDNVISLALSPCHNCYTRARQPVIMMKHAIESLAKMKI